MFLWQTPFFVCNGGLVSKGLANIFDEQSIKFDHVPNKLTSHKSTARAALIAFGPSHHFVVMGLPKISTDQWIIMATIIRFNIPREIKIGTTPNDFQSLSDNSNETKGNLGLSHPVNFVQVMENDIQEQICSCLFHGNANFFWYPQQFFKKEGNPQLMMTTAPSDVIYLHFFKIITTNGLKIGGRCVCDQFLASTKLVGMAAQNSQSQAKLFERLGKDGYL